MFLRKSVKLAVNHAPKRHIDAAEGGGGNELHNVVRFMSVYVIDSPTDNFSTACSEL